MIAKQDGRRAHAAPLGNLHDRVGGQEGTARAPEGTIRDYVDVFLFAEVDDLLLW
jgi:hypothetical protein